MKNSEESFAQGRARVLGLGFDIEDAFYQSAIKRARTEGNEKALVEALFHAFYMYKRENRFDVVEDIVRQMMDLGDKYRGSIDIYIAKDLLRCPELSWLSYEFSTAVAPTHLSLKSLCSDWTWYIELLLFKNASDLGNAEDVEGESNDELSTIDSFLSAYSFYPDPAPLVDALRNKKEVLKDSIYYKEALIRCKASLQLKEYLYSEDHSADIALMDSAILE